MPTKTANKRRVGAHLTELDRDEAQRVFLKAFRDTGIVRSGADKAGVTRAAVTYWVKSDPDFAARYAEAEEDAKDRIRAEIHRRAVTGWKEPVYQGGKKVGEITRYSDTILKMLAASRMPEYRDRMDVTTAGQPLGSYEAIAHLANDSDAAAHISAALARLAGAGIPTDGAGMDRE